MYSFKFVNIFSLLLMFTTVLFSNEEIEEYQCKCFEVKISDEFSLSTTIDSLNIDESRVQIIYEIKL